MPQKTFGTAINCMDGRVQQPVIDWMKETLQVDYVDMITAPGPNKILALGPVELQDWIKSRVDISVEKHGSEVIVITGHDDCAGHPVTKDEHITHVEESMNLIREWNLPVKIIGLWIDDSWKVHHFKEYEKP